MAILRATRGGGVSRIAPTVSPVIFALTLACSCAAQDNLLENPSFEVLDETTARPAGWTAWAEPNYAVYTLADARTGVACVAITDLSEKVSQGLRSPRVPIEPGRQYRASAWARIESGPKPGAALYLEYWAGGTRVENKSVSISDAPDWRMLSLSVTAPEGATHATVLVYSGSVSVGRAYFDDLALVEEPAP
ncbi:MAG: carbohydrate binding domain-containing protein [Armatimonadetes bacterium]|nr:carbohydrate binding domain-containing protein [Armatimonadota bacterium]